MEIGILGYWDINSSKRVLDGWITVFQNLDNGISDPLNRGPKVILCEFLW